MRVGSKRCGGSTSSPTRLRAAHSSIALMARPAWPAPMTRTVVRTGASAQFTVTETLVGAFENDAEEIAAIERARGQPPSSPSRALMSMNACSSSKNSRL